MVSRCLKILIVNLKLKLNKKKVASIGTLGVNASKFKKNIAILPFTNKIDDATLPKAVKNMPDNSILVLEDIDCLFTERKKDDQHKNQISFSAILNQLDGLTFQEDLITIMTTNYYYYYYDCYD